MKRLIPRDRMTAVLLALCGLLMMVVLAEIYIQEPANQAIDLEVANASIELPANVHSRFIPNPESNYAEILERPLLFAGRRMPHEPEVSAEPAKPKSPLRLKLEGVALSMDSRVALLRNLVDNQLLQLAEGMSHDGWILETVNATSATFKRGNDLSEILLETETNKRRRR